MPIPIDRRIALIHNVFPIPNPVSGTNVSNGISFNWGSYSVDGNTTTAFRVTNDHPLGYTSAIRMTRTAAATNAWGVYPVLNVTQVPNWLENVNMYATVWIRSSFATSVASRMENTYANANDYYGATYNLSANTWRLMSVGPFTHVTTNSSSLSMAFTAYIVSAGQVGDWVEMTGMTLCTLPPSQSAVSRPFSLQYPRLQWKGTTNQSESIGYPVIY